MLSFSSRRETVYHPFLTLWRHLRLTLSELKSWRTLSLALVSMALAIPATLSVGIGVHVSTLGQDIELSARTPSLSPGGYGRVVEGPRSFDLPHLFTYSPIRPQMSFTPVATDLRQLIDPATGQTIRDGAAHALVMGFVWWYLIATLVLFLIGLVICAALGHFVARVFGHRLVTTESGRHVRRITPHQILAVMLVIMTAWLGAGVTAAIGAKPLTHVHSLPDLFGQGDPLLIQTPAPAGHVETAYKGLAMTDSRGSAVGVHLVPNPTDDDRRCERSTSSIALQIQDITGLPTRNVGCPSASLAAGIEGPQMRDDRPVVPQIALAKNMRGLKFVVLMIGPNDLWWSNLMGYCFVETDCYDNLTDNAFKSQLDQFTQDYYLRLIPDLLALPDHPHIYVVLSYGVYWDNANCRDTMSPVGHINLHDAPPGGKPGDKIRLMNQRNKALNDVLRAGAEANPSRFSVIDPLVRRLCTPDPEGLGPDIRGIADHQRFHLTPNGIHNIAWQISSLEIAREHLSK